MSRRLWLIVLTGAGLFLSACNSNAAEPAVSRHPDDRPAADDRADRHRSVFAAIQFHDDGDGTGWVFDHHGAVSRHGLRREAQCLFGPQGMVYVVGQYDVPVIDSRDCRTTLSEFRHLDRNVVFVGSFDQNDERRWVYLSAVQRPEWPIEKR